MDCHPGPQPPSAHGRGALCLSVAPRGAIECAQIRELLFQFRQRVLEHHLITRVLTCLHLLLQVGASQQQCFLLAQRCGPFRGQTVPGSFLPLRLRGFNLRLCRFAFPASGHEFPSSGTACSSSLAGVCRARGICEPTDHFTPTEGDVTHKAGRHRAPLGLQMPSGSSIVMRVIAVFFFS